MKPSLPLLAAAVCIHMLTAPALQPGQAYTFYDTAPAPAPGSCPYGYSNATLDVEVTEGPYYVEEDLFRSDIRESEVGVPFTARITVLDTNCNPVVGAFVDIWHCNASGVYSSYTGVSTSGNPTAAMGRRLLAEQTTDNTTFLRGTVETDMEGLAAFQTIFPGWYQGRVTHIHMKVHIPEETDGSLEAEYADSYVAHTGQFFFEEDFLDTLYTLQPYSENTNVQRTALEDDMVFISSGDDMQLLFEINEVEPGNLAAGIVGSVTAVIDPSANHTDAGMGSAGGAMGMGPMPQGMGSDGSFGQAAMTGLPPQGSALPQLPQGALPTLGRRKLRMTY